MLLLTGILAHYRHPAEESSTRVSIRTAAKVMSNSFLDDPMNGAQLQGITNPEKLLKVHSLLHARHAAQHGSLHILDDEDPRAFMIGYDSLDRPWLSEKLLMLKMVMATIWNLSLQDFRMLTKNIKRHGKALNLSWYKRTIKGRHYRMKVIAVDPMLRGTGAFRRLITPALDYADAERIPVVLETHNPKNMGLYEHFGFELVSTITSSETHISQYCMIRQPQWQRYKQTAKS